jgi:hypothetical protein
MEIINAPYTKPCKRDVYIIIERKEQQFLKVQKLLAEKKKLMYDKHEFVSKESINNKFLEMVKKDYEKYNNYILEQKRQQIDSLETINKYIDELNKTNQLSKYNLQDSKVEQKKILNEIQKIKTDLDEIIEKTTNYNN